MIINQYPTFVIACVAVTKYYSTLGFPRLFFQVGWHHGRRGVYKVGGRAPKSFNRSLIRSVNLSGNNRMMFYVKVKLTPSLRCRLPIL